MTIQRLPHPVFAGLWIAWSAAVFVALGRPGAPLFGLIVLLSFFPIEITAAAWNTGSRDTLSEIATWCQRKLSKHTRLGRGWNALLLLYVLCVTYLVARTFYTFAASLPLAAGVFVLATIWLHDHWMSPTEHG